MNASRFARGAGVCALLVVLGLAVLVGGASAAATTGTFYNQETIVFPDTSICSGLDGTTTNTITETGHTVDNGTTTHVEGTTTQDYRSDWSDGTYLISHSPSHFAFNANSAGTTVFTEAQQDRGTLYAADGHVLGYQTVFTLTHLTWRGGDIVSSVSEFRVSC
jgi:hypothetical protein